VTTYRCCGAQFFLLILSFSCVHHPNSWRRSAFSAVCVGGSTTGRKRESDIKRREKKLRRKANRPKLTTNGKIEGFGRKRRARRSAMENLKRKKRRRARKLNQTTAATKADGKWRKSGSTACAQNNGSVSCCVRWLFLHHIGTLLDGYYYCYCCLFFFAR
jgi:hypothetical protein